MAETKRKRISSAIKESILKLFEAAGSKTYRLPDETVRELYRHGFLKTHTDLCWKWATYQLSPAGIDVGSKYYK